MNLLPKKASFPKFLTLRYTFRLVIFVFWSEMSWNVLKISSVNLDVTTNMFLIRLPRAHLKLTGGVVDYLTAVINSLPKTCYNVDLFKRAF